VFRSLVAADLPIVSVAKGGTALTAIGSGNQVLGVNSGGSGLEYKTITAGSNVTVTHGAGSITIAATAGGGSPAGSATELQYRNAGAFAAAGINVINSGLDLQLDTTTGTKIGTATTQKLAFYNSTPIVQPSTTGTSIGHTAGVGTTVTDDSTFSGNTGTKAYRINDIVRALKQLGLLASS
jgi:hypothetical protein